MNLNVFDLLWLPILHVFYYYVSHSTSSKTASGRVVTSLQNFQDEAAKLLWYGSLMMQLYEAKSTSTHRNAAKNSFQIEFFGMAIVHNNKVILLLAYIYHESCFFCFSETVDVEVEMLDQQAACCIRGQFLLSKECHHWCSKSTICHSRQAESLLMHRLCQHKNSNAMVMFFGLYGCNL